MDLPFLRGLPPARRLRERRASRLDLSVLLAMAAARAAASPTAIAQIRLAGGRRREEAGDRAGLILGTETPNEIHDHRFADLPPTPVADDPEG